MNVTGIIGPDTIDIEVDGEVVFRVERGTVTLSTPMPEGYFVNHLRVYFDDALVYEIIEGQGVVCDLVNFKQLIS
jgi:hypothetical protein